MNDAIPMRSARMGNGRYEVIGTSTACEVVRVGSDWPIWILYSDGQFVDSFTTKRAALIYCQEHPEL